MKGWWIEFGDGSHGYCEGEDEKDAREIASHFMDCKTVVSALPIPYPARPIIWRFTHPISGPTPAFCQSPEYCSKHHHCPGYRSCVG